MSSREEIFRKALQIIAANGPVEKPWTAQEDCDMTGLAGNYDDAFAAGQEHDAWYSAEIAREALKSEVL